MNNAVQFLWGKLGWVVYLWVGFQIVCVVVAIGIIGLIFYGMMKNKF